MKTTMLLVAMLTLASGDIAHAVTLFTPMARAEAGSMLACRAVNVGRKPVAITVTRGDLNGTDAQTSCTSVAPGSACAAVQVGPLLGYCRFDFEGNKRGIRGSVAVEDTAGTRLLIEAR